jgi:uncharacterized paraquat-inducible protein A
MDRISPSPVVGFKGVAYWPMVCGDCRILVSVPVERTKGEDAQATCPRCGGLKLTALSEESRGSGGEVHLAQTAPCPRCTEEVAVILIGDWD